MSSFDDKYYELNTAKFLRIEHFVKFPVLEIRVCTYACTCQCMYKNCFVLFINLSTLQPRINSLFRDIFQRFFSYV